MAKETFVTISLWSDLGSMVLLGLSIVVAGLSPCRPIWGRSRKQQLALVAAFSATVLFSVFRFVVEGMFEATGPREFLAGTVVYISRWLWLYWRMSRPASEEARLFEVARALRLLHMLRIGYSTDDKNEIDRRGEWEVVRRRGVAETPSGEHCKSYWRGVKERADRFVEQDDCWDVRLVQEHLHAGVLDVIGTIEYMNKDEAAMDEAYRRFYKVVMTAVATRRPTQREMDAAVYRPGSHVSQGATAQQSALSQTASNSPAVQRVATISNPLSAIVSTGSTVGQIAPLRARHSTNIASQSQERQRPDREVDFSPFFARWRGVPVQALAENVKAGDVRPIGNVARRVAADAVAFVNDKRMFFRTEQQVTIINQCLEAAASRQFPSLNNSGHDAV